MLKNEITYPVAYDFDRRQIISISDVTNENKSHLGCPYCRHSFVAVRNHQTPHFKHKARSSCSVSQETYLHWVTKEVFKEIKEIELPELLIDDLPGKQRQRFQAIFNEIIDHNMPESFRGIFIKSLKNNLSESLELKIDGVHTEIDFETELGNIRVDIVVDHLQRKLFIEPFFSNPIDNEKRRKLQLINIPTLSIDLKVFIDHFGSTYTLQNLNKYLISKLSKKWIYLQDKVYDRHIDNYKKYLLEEIEKNKSSIDFHYSNLEKISGLEKRVSDLNMDIKIAQDQKEAIEQNIYYLKEEIGLNYR